MVDRIGTGGGGLARQAIESALKRQGDATRRLAEIAQSQSAALSGGPGGVGGANGASEFASELTKGIVEISKTAQRVEDLPEAVVRGEITDFHEVTAQLKQAELSLKFALEVRDKFVDAYREVMRMSV